MTIIFIINFSKLSLPFTSSFPHQGFQTRTEPGDWIMKTGNRDENRFFKHKKYEFLLILWTPKTEVGPHELMARTVRSNPLAIFFFFFKQLNTILFYLIKLSISYKE